MPAVPTLVIGILLWIFGTGLWHTLGVVLTLLSGIGVAIFLVIMLVALAGFGFAATRGKF